MGAVKAAYEDTISSMFEQSHSTISEELIPIEMEIDQLLLFLLNQEAEGLRLSETRWAKSYEIDGFDFLADWGHRIAAAIGIFSGLATADDPMVKQSFDMMALSYHFHPRSVAVAMQRAGMTDRAIQGIIYLLAGRILEANEHFSILSFEYQKKRA